MNNEFINIYAKFLKKFLKPEKPLKVVFDCSNGTAGSVLNKLLKAKSSKLQAIFLNEKPDGNFPAHGPNPLEFNALKQLQNEVKKQKADLGVIFDGDGDRTGFIDNKGHRVDSDVIASLLIWHLKPKIVVIDVLIGNLIKKISAQNSYFSFYVSPVGHYSIKKFMVNKKADFGYEHSGHYYFKKFYYDVSGILAAIEVINAVSKLPYSLANFVDLLSQYYRSGELNFKVKNPQEILKKIERKLKIHYSKLITQNSHLDGLTMEFSDWWFNLRPSNTEPLIRLNIEATSKNILNQKIKELRNFLENS